MLVVVLDEPVSFRCTFGAVVPVVLVVFDAPASFRSLRIIALDTVVKTLAAPADDVRRLRRMVLDVEELVLDDPSRGIMTVTCPATLSVPLAVVVVLDVPAIFRALRRVALAVVVVVVEAETASLLALRRVALDVLVVVLDADILSLLTR